MKHLGSFGGFFRVGVGWVKIISLMGDRYNVHVLEHVYHSSLIQFQPTALAIGKIVDELGILLCIITLKVLI